MNDQTVKKEELPTLEVQQRLALFGQSVLRVLNEHQLWGSYTVEEISQVAQNHSLSYTTSEGYWRATAEALGAELEELHFSEFMDLFGLVTILGDGFHPDTPMADYVDTDGNRTFDEQTTDVLQEILDNCHRVFGDAIYGLSLEMCRSEHKFGLTGLDDDDDWHPVDAY